jgi:hypothetical protein
MASPPHFSKLPLHHHFPNVNADTGNYTTAQNCISFVEG